MFFRDIFPGCRPPYRTGRELERRSIGTFQTRESLRCLTEISRRQFFVGRYNLDPAIAQLVHMIVCWRLRSEEHTSELQSLMRISYAVFCLKKKKQNKKNTAIND